MPPDKEHWKVLEYKRNLYLEGIESSISDEQNKKTSRAATSMRNDIGRLQTELCSISAVINEESSQIFRHNVEFILQKVSSRNGGKLTKKHFVVAAEYLPMKEKLRLLQMRDDEELDVKNNEFLIDNFVKFGLSQMDVESLIEQFGDLFECLREYVDKEKQISKKIIQRQLLYSQEINQIEQDLKKQLVIFGEKIRMAESLESLQEISQELHSTELPCAKHHKYYEIFRLQKCCV